MVERELLQPIGQGSVRIFISRPEQAGRRYPLCVLLMDAPGYRDELNGMARRLATAGYAVAVPDLYHRSIAAGLAPDPQQLAPDAPDRREIIYRHMHRVTLATAAEDLRAVLAATADDPQIDREHVGLFGYCMSGPLALGLAPAFAGTVAAAASIHGVRLFHRGVASPHRRLPATDAELYIACAEHDDWAPPSLIEQLGSWLTRAGVQHQIDWYPGTQHGFVFPQRAGLYLEAAAERHWAALNDLFERTLKA
ncbi:MAG: dienelactone hydrolase family protein [Pseudomonadota bacterium]